MSLKLSRIAIATMLYCLFAALAVCLTIVGIIHNGTQMTCAGFGVLFIATIAVLDLSKYPDWLMIAMAVMMHGVGAISIVYATGIDDGFITPILVIAVMFASTRLAAYFKKQGLKMF
jgi:hypothetical protein